MIYGGGMDEEKQKGTANIGGHVQHYKPKHNPLRTCVPANGLILLFSKPILDSSHRERPPAINKTHSSRFCLARVVPEHAWPSILILVLRLRLRLRQG